MDVSIVITCFNYSEYIGAAIESVFASVGENLRLELIVVDDASKDGSAGIIRAVLATAPIPMVLFRTWWNVGVSRSRNLGVARAGGKYVFTLDADNRLQPGAIRALYVEAELSGADAAFGPVHRVKLDGTSDGIVSNQPFNPERLRQKGNYIDAMALFRRSTLIDVGGYDVNLLKVIGGWEDYELWLRLDEKGSIVVFVDQPIGIYLVKPDSMVSRISNSELLEFINFVKKRYSGYSYLEELS